MQVGSYKQGMERKTVESYDEISQGYQRFRRGNIWWVRFSIKGQNQQRLSLGTSDEDDAEVLARQKWLESCLLVKHGIAVNGKTFKTAAEEFIEVLKQDVRRGARAPYQAKQYPNIIRTYFIPYFGKRALDTIKAPDIERYWDWRRDYWITGPGSKHPFIIYKRVFKGQERLIRRPVKEGYPSDSTLAKEALTLTQIFDHGLRRGYTKQVPLIAIRKSKKRELKARPGFTIEEFRHLLDVSHKRVWEGHINGHVRNDRARLHAYCDLAGMTGLRPTELLNLRWSDIERRTLQIIDGVPLETIVLHVRGKGKERETATMPEILTSLNILRQLFLLELAREPSANDPVFCNADGTSIRSFKIGLKHLLDAAGLRETNDGRRRDSFSFRHFYITQQVRHNVNPHVLARNAGTSTQMIDQYYSKIRPTEEVKKLTPDWFGHRLFKP